MQEQLQRLESLIGRDISVWFREMLQALQNDEEDKPGQVDTINLADPVGKIAKEQNPLPGFVLSRLSNQTWWAFWNQRLAEALTKRLMEAGKTGAHGALRQLGMKPSWDWLLPQIEEWAKAQAASLVKDVAAEAQEEMRRAVVNGLANGKGWQEVRAQIATDTGLESWRAERIARTEVIRAHAQGTVNAYEQSGTVRGVRWLSGQAQACPKCRELHNQVQPLGKPFYQDAQFGDGLPPRHPNCRCALTPVTVEQAKHYPTDHPLRNNEREGLAGLTDRDTMTVIEGVTVSGQAKRHWRLRHGGQFDVGRAEAMLPELLSRPAGIKEHTGAEMRYMPWSSKNYLVAVITPDQRLATIYLKEKKKVDKWPIWPGK